MHRRAFMRAAGLAALVGAAGSAFGARPAAADPIWHGLFRDWVPEIFAPIPDAPEHSPAIVVGSGFGASVTALRLAQAGVATTVLERGSRWPNDPWREIFTGDDLPDGRGFWHRTSFTGVTKVPMSFAKFGGVLDCTEYPGIDVWRAAAVGGGSVIFTGAMVAPERRFFDEVFHGAVAYDELERVYYPRVRQMLRLSTMPADIYGSSPFTHSRAWDEQVRKAGYEPLANDSIFRWDVLRAELAGQSRPSATAARSNLGNSNGAKFDLNQNYLKFAQETGKSAIFPGHRVDAIAQESGGRYAVTVTKLAPTGDVLGTRTLTCDRLFLGAGSVGTSELLVRAQATGALGNLNEHIGDGWGTNGDVVLARGASSLAGLGQGVPSASRILDESNVPVTLESWYIPGIPFETGAMASLGMVLDPARTRFGYDAGRDAVGLSWPTRNRDEVVAAARAVDRKIAERAGALVEYSALGYDANALFTAHPLGGAVLGKATDGYGRVHGHPGLYVMDGAAIPGSTGTVNPSLTITALAERNIEQIIRAGR
ncbi:GMC family oxidoreductase [Nocardia puris]|uniref:Cholesterol oxidase n=2 Tax=Nocardia puris TaxID=208602 RepID=A0A366D410_9NOCA|nr:GMC family oxidoreductase [Nocardia puris]MBF6368540.1 GMC family oxidoreductase [Nocardia puris]MBF6463027.1 GMC family oxidoreductase [Nocardia puris]RBO84229.1 cholesterol oxidase [Nocardia puris]